MVYVKRQPGGWKNRPNASTPVMGADLDHFEQTFTDHDDWISSSVRAGSGFSAAWESASVSVLREWFRRTTGPRVPVDEKNPVRGIVTLATQADADALVGRLVVGGVEIAASGIVLSDVIIRGSGVKNVIAVGRNATGWVIRNVEVDGQYDVSIERGIAGENTSGSAGHSGLIERTNIHSLNDGALGFANTTYRHVWIHSPYRHVGAYDPDIHPHSDGIQTVSGSGLLVDECFLDIQAQGAQNIISCMIFNSSTLTPITGATVRRSYLAGGGYTLRALDGGNGIPTGLVFDSNRFGGGFTTGLFLLDGGGTFTGNNVWADTLSPIPTTGGAAAKRPVIRDADPLRFGYAETYMGVLSQQIWSAANTSRYLRIISPARIRNVSFEVAVSSGEISVGVYRGTKDGLNRAPGELLASKTLPCPAVGFATVDLGQDLEVYPGDYLAMSCDNVVAAFAGFSGSATRAHGSRCWSSGGHPLATDPVVTAGGLRSPGIIGHM